MPRQLNTAQGAIMDILGRQEYREQSDATALSLASEADLSNVSVAGTLGSLVRLGLVQRKRRKGTNYYELTDHGLAVQGHRESTRRWKEMRSPG